jgi:hypothetical protein
LPISSSGFDRREADAEHPYGDSAVGGDAPAAVVKKPHKVPSRRSADLPIHERRSPELIRIALACRGAGQDVQGEGFAVVRRPQIWRQRLHHLIQNSTEQRELFWIVDSAFIRKHRRRFPLVHRAVDSDLVELFVPVRAEK